MVAAPARAHHGGMTTSYSPFGTGTAASHPTLDWAVTPDQRARAEDWLQRAYTEGRLSHEEFDRRMGMALEASTRRELNAAFEGVATIPTSFPGESSFASQPGFGAQGQPAFYGSPSASMSPYGNRGALSRQGGTAMGAVAHLSAPFFPLVGAGVIGVMSPRGTATHREAAKAFNASLSAMVILGVLSVLSNPSHPHSAMTMLTGLVWVAWFVFSVVGAMKARNGANWTNPFTRVLPLRLMREC